MSIVSLMSLEKLFFFQRFFFGTVSQKSLDYHSISGTIKAPKQP